MDAATELLYDAALALPDDERLELLEALIASEDLSTRETFDSEILQEFKRRSDEIEAGVVQSSPWSQVRERVRKRLEERSRG